MQSVLPRIKYPILVGSLLGTLMVPVALGLRSHASQAASPGSASVTVVLASPTSVPSTPQPVRKAVFSPPTRLPRIDAAQPVSGARSWTCTASTYGYDYRGVPYSAASKEIPHGHHARVTAPNGRSVTVLINDSGPYVSGRCIDLSMTAMHALGYPEGLIDNVRVQELP